MSDIDGVLIGWCIGAVSMAVLFIALPERRHRRRRGSIVLPKVNAPADVLPPSAAIAPPPDA